ncbi:uncharacterized protein LOC144159200 isoform X5 [Haemaphysalis longicornis]
MSANVAPVYQLLDNNGAPVIENGRPVYVTVGGTPVDVVAAEAVGAPEAAGDASNRSDALWPRPKALFLISAFKLFQTKHSRRQYTKRSMWEDLALQVNVEFPGSEFTPAQIENKWRTADLESGENGELVPQGRRARSSPKCWKKSMRPTPHTWQDPAESRGLTMQVNWPTQTNQKAQVWGAMPLSSRRRRQLRRTSSHSSHPL